MYNLRTTTTLVTWSILLPRVLSGPSEPAPARHSPVADSPWLLFNTMVSPILEFYITEIVPMVNFHVELFSLSVMLLRVTHAVACISSLLLLTAE